MRRSTAAKAMGQSAEALHDLIENRFRAATLYGKLANIAGDLDAKWLDSTALFKAITGGDTIMGEHKFGAAFDFTPWALPIFSANKADEFNHQYFSPGIHYLVTPDLEVGVRVGWGLNDQSARFFSNVGFGLRF